MIVKCRTHIILPKMLGFHHRNYLYLYKMNRIFIILFLFFYTFDIAYTKENEHTRELIIYTEYEFVKYGLSSKTIPLFEQENNCDVKIITYENSDKIIFQANKERENPHSDILFGIDKRFLIKVKKDTIVQSYQPKNYRLIEQKVLFDTGFYLIPYCYNYLAFIYNSDMISEPPETFGMFLNGNWNKSLLIPNPNTSEIGSSFFLWTVAMFDKYGYLKFWKGFEKVIKEITLSWDKSYCLFLEGKVPMIIGYVNLQAYYSMNDESNCYKAFIPQEGTYCQIKNLCITNNCPHPELAKKFVEYVLSEEFQKYLPLTQWMFPVNKNIILPEPYKNIPKISKVVDVPLQEIDENYDYWLRQWNKNIKIQK